MLKALVACEESGIARRALEAHAARIGADIDVWSCDLLPAEDRSNRHIVCDVRDGILNEGWDLLVVMHPPCTRLCRSGRRWMSGPGKWTQPKLLPKGRTLQSMRDEFELGVDVFTACWTAPIAHVAIENPVMNDLAKERMPHDLPAPHMTQPFWFGDPTYKQTGWYLRDLPELQETDRLIEPERDSDEWKRWNRIHRMPPGPNRAKQRSRSSVEMMTAAAAQWTNHVLQDIEQRKAA
ncbi:hypothetical protein [Aliiroseovarius lamellibrachiae]|uniref:hypothetical protein n=1 Tax=Aliiroseovarius lamellibrachiae TaxID=1924933 RepID=UPI001BE04D41|nr:hypothetical protein [Aliiroseovarius lamellibrachiae]MBT2130089.1 hypothetical protein [Aliiroseovarius lamellibrachiae]